MTAEMPGLSQTPEHGRNERLYISDPEYGSLGHLGVVRLVECAGPALAMPITGDRRLRDRCQLIGDRHLAVPVDREPEFRKALPALGYLLLPDTRA